MQDNMKTILKIPFVRLASLVSLLCVLCASVVNSPAQEFKTLKGGIEYAEVRREFSGKAVNVNLLRLDLRKVRLDVHHAMDAAIGTEKTSSIAARHGAFAAINAGFFRLDKSEFAGDSSNVLMVDGKLLSEPANDRIQLGILNLRRGSNVFLTRSSVSLHVACGRSCGLSVFGINRERRKDDVVIYTGEFGKITPAGTDVTEVVIVDDHNIAFVQEEGGKTPIPPSGFVISACGLHRSFLETITDRQRKVLLREVWTRLPKPLATDRRGLDMVAGVPQLIKNGKIDITWELEKSTKAFVETRHPRTAVAKLKDGKFLMITADGRSESSAGIDLYDLAAYLLSLGATDAMNLDGGGSTTMFVDGKVVNKPSDKEGERKVSDAILITPRKKK